MKAVLVTTEYRGVFFGYLDENESDLPTKAVLRDTRCCVYWAKSVRGVLGLAAKGPNKECRVGFSVSRGEVWKVTGVFECSSEAVKAWEEGSWA